MAPRVRGVPVTIGIVALLAWAHGLLNIWPLPPRSDVLPLQMQWSLWWESLAVTLAGVTAAVLALRSVRLWWLAIFLTSGAILALSLPAVLQDIARADSVREWFGVFYENMRGSTLYLLFVVPLYHLALACGSLVYGLLSIASRVRANATVA